MKRRMLFGLLTALPLAAALAASPAGALPDSACTSLLAVGLPDTTIKSAQEVAEPAFTPPGSAALTRLPAFCRVVAVTRPAVNFEVWLPKWTEQL